MISQYSPKHFYRKMPNVLLSEYFETKGISLEVDWSNLEGKKGVETLFEAIKAIPDEAIQSSIEVDFQMPICQNPALIADNQSQSNQALACELFDAHVIAIQLA